MPIIKRITLDMFELASVSDYMVNLVNLRGALGAGLAAEFKRRLGEDYNQSYREACFNNNLRIGTLHIYEDTKENWSVLGLPTKRHYADTSDPNDISRGLEAMRNFLSEEKNKNSVVTMPLPGVGLGKLDYSTVLPLVEQYLGDLEAAIFICMSPERTEERPRYLTIAGPLDYGRTDDEKAQIDSVIARVTKKWDIDLADYENIVSGSYPGVDAYITGEHYGKGYENTYAFRATGKIPLVVKPNTYRNGVGANLHLGNLLCEIGEDVILFKPPNHNNNRLSAMQTWLLANKEERERHGLIPRRVAVFGEVGIMRTSEDVMIPQEADIPY